MSTAERMDPTRREHFVYRCYDGRDRLLYVGCTMNLDRRLSEHKADRKVWLPKVRRTRLAGPYNYDVARQIERDAIRDESPTHNVTPQRQSAKYRRLAWIDRQMRRDPRLRDDISTSDYLRIYEEWARKAKRIDWNAIGERAIAARTARRAA